MQKSIVSWLIISLSFLPGALLSARDLTLDQAIQLALRQNSLLKMARLKVEENGHKADAARANYYPKLKNSSYISYMTELQRVEIPGGSLGHLPIIGPVPSAPISLFQGRNGIAMVTTTLGQPVTQLYKIRQGRRIAKLDAALSATDLEKAEHEVGLKVQQIYYALLISQRKKRAAELELTAAEQRLRESKDAVETGEALEVATLGSRAKMLKAKQELLVLENQISDLTMELDDITGLPLETELTLAEPKPATVRDTDTDSYVGIALSESPEVRAARQMVEKARSAVKAAKADYIPEVSVFAQHIYQNGVPFFPRNNGVFGARLEWNVFDFGKRASTLASRETALAEAEENLRRVRNRVVIETEKAVRKLQRSRQMLEVAREARAVRRESARLVSDQYELGVALKSKQQTGRSELATAEADLLAAELGVRLAWAELQRTVGRSVR